jgi:hypothetical protein
MEVNKVMQLASARGPGEVNCTALCAGFMNRDINRNSDTQV